MANISVEPEKLKPSITRTGDLAQRLKSLSGTVDDIQRNLGYKIAAQEAIASRLRDVTSQCQSRVESIKNGCKTAQNSGECNHVEITTHHAILRRL